MSQSDSPASASIGAVRLEQRARDLEALCKAEERSEQARISAPELQAMLIATARDLRG